MIELQIFVPQRNRRIQNADPTGSAGEIRAAFLPLWKAIEQDAHFFGGVLVVLFDRQFEGGSEDRSGFVELASGQKDFSKFDAGNHPVGLRICTPAEMELRIRGAASFHKRLREAETEKYVVGLLIDEV